MATPFDFAFLDNFSSIFVLLFVLVAFYAIMNTRKFLGTNSAIHFTLAFAVAVLFIFSKYAIDSIKFIIPWMMVLMFAFLMIVMAMSVFVGGDVFQFLSGMGVLNTWYNWVFAIAIIIIALGVSNSVGQDVGPFLSEDGNATITNAAGDVRGTGDVASSDFQQNLGATIFHPKVLSLILVFFLLAMAGFYITKMT